MPTARPKLPARRQCGGWASRKSCASSAVSGLRLVEPGAIETPLWGRGDERARLAPSSAASVELTDALYADGDRAFRKLVLAPNAPTQNLRPRRSSRSIERAPRRPPAPQSLPGRSSTLAARPLALALRFPDRPLDFAAARLHAACPCDALTGRARGDRGSGGTSGFDSRSAAHQAAPLRSRRAASAARSEPPRRRRAPVARAGLG